MSISPGTYWSAKLAKDLKRIANTISVVYRAEGTRCPGAFDPYSNEYDPGRDADYHAANPLVPVCVHGLIGAGETTGTILGFHLPNLKDADLLFLSVGELDANHAVLITGNDQNLSHIDRYEFPLGSEIYWNIEDGYRDNGRTIQLNGVDMFRYCVSVRK